MRMFPDGYSLVGGVFTPKERGLIDSYDYSDGEDFECKIEEIVAAASDRSLFSPELRAAIWDWRSACHLSPVRANILRPLEVICRGRVLELGSGCGIITRYLGELGGDVVALEASSRRASVTRQRTVDLSNVKVVCERIEEFDSANKFDVVTMIGVLQYARLFSRCGERAEIDLLRSASRQLKDDGMLVIAIQNKLGLKYFSGFPEPNVDTPFYGIENRYNGESIVRFGLKEILGVLRGVGLEHVEVLLPLPDYHMPVSILSQAGSEPSVSSLGETLLKLGVVHDRSRPDWVVPTFSIEKAWESVYRNGLAKDLANSFLIVAGKKVESLGLVRAQHELAWHYSVSRHPYYAVEKKFKYIDNSITVTRNRVAKASPPSVLLTHHVTPEAFVQGRHMWVSLLDILNEPGWSVSEVGQWSLKWLRAISAHLGLGTGFANFSDIEVSGEFFDLTPMNCIEADDGSVVLIDREWVLHKQISLHYLAIRGIVGSLLQVSSCAEPVSGTPLNIVELARAALLVGSGIRISDDHVRSYIVEESSIQGLIRNGKDSGVVDESWKGFVMSAKLAVRVDLRGCLQQFDKVSGAAYEGSSLAHRVETLIAENVGLKSGLAISLAELNAIKGSAAFRLLNSVRRCLSWCRR